MPEIKKYLSKNGLEDYNELLPHSATQMQEYVADWLDAHPEATTTVEDNSITTAKLRDGCVTTQKIADESVTTRKISQELYQLIVGNVLRGSDSGNIVSVNDAFPAFPLEVVVDGKSTQDGTPTPDAPVPIESVDELALAFAGKNLCPTADGTTIASDWVREGQNYILHTGVYGNGSPYTLSCRMASAPSATGTTNRFYILAAGESAAFCDLNEAGAKSATVTVSGEILLRINVTGAANVSSLLGSIQLELGSTATAYEPYTGHTVPIPLQDHVLRSLPDDTKDTLALTYLRPSTREGWAWYTPTMVQSIGYFANIGTLSWNASSAKPHGFYANVVNSIPYLYAENVQALCTAYQFAPSRSVLTQMADNTFSVYYSSTSPTSSIRELYAINPNASTVNDFIASADGVSIIYQLATPITTTLDPIELPVLPAPTCTVWADPTTGVMLSYERDLTIAINAIEQAIADQ